MESSDVTILGSGNPSAQGSLEESRLPGGVCSSRMLIGPTGSTGIIQSCEVGGLSGAGFLSPTTTAPSLDCTLKCSVTVAVPSHPGNASFRVGSSAESNKGTTTTQQQIEGLLSRRKFSTQAAFFASPCRNDDDKDDDDDDEEDDEDGVTFDSFELQNNDDDDEQDQVPIGEILEKLQAGSSSPGYPGSSGRNGSGANIIRLHAVHDDSETPTISATVNVAALDLSDPDSIYRHLSQLNDTVLRVSAKNSNSQSDSGRQTPDVNFMDSPPVHARDVLTPTPIHSPRSPSPSLPTTDSALSSSASLKIETSLSKPPYLPASIQLPTSPLALATSCPTPSPSAFSPSQQSISSSSCSETSPILIQGKTSSSAGSLGKSTPQSCAICCKVFSNASALAKHRLTHSEERRYHCSICSKAFKRQDHLNGHLLTHRSTKPFACQVDGCGKSYCDARSLRRHKENHHSGILKQQQQQQQQQQHHTMVSLPPLASVQTPTPMPMPIPTPTPTLTLTPKVVETVQAEPLIARSSLGDTKIMFSSKGLTAQQLQLIEQLLKESRSGKLVSMPASQSFTAMPSTSFTLPTVPLSSSSSSMTTTPRFSHCISKRMPPVAEKLTACSTTMTLGDKPVECTICSRKFKNIPALNGHMRLHGGYYKKDSDGKRIPLTANLKQNNLKLSKFCSMPPKAGTKRKCPTLGQPDFTPEKKSSLCPISVQSSLSSLQPVTSAMFSIISSGPKSTLSPSLNLNSSHFEPSKPVSICHPPPPPPPPPPVVPQPSLAFQSLPPPDTNKLLENLEKKNFGMVSMKTESYETCFKEKPKPLLHLSKGVGVKETGARMGNFVTTYGLPAISLPTKPIPQLQLEETSSLQHLRRPSAPPPKPVCVKPEPILPNEIPEMKVDIKEEISVPESVSFPACSFLNHDDDDASAVPSAGSGNVANLLSSSSSSGLNQFLSSSGLSCQSKSHQHQMLKVDLESDKTPKVGEEFQADVPDCQASRGTADDCLDTLLWNPDTLLDDVDIDDYLMLASSCAVHLGSHNEELALEVLQKHDGNLTDAVQELLASPDDDDDEDDEDDDDVGSHQLDADSEASDMEEDEDDEEEESILRESASNPWSELEVNAFYEGLVKHKKDFVKISQQIGTRSVEECVDFYYLWKNFCPDESNSFKSIFFSQGSKAAASQDPSGRDFANNSSSNNNNNNHSLQGQDPESTSLE